RRGAEVARERVAEPERAGIARARPAGAEQPDRREVHVAGHDADAAERVVLRDLAAREREELGHLGRELVRVEGAEGTERLRVRAPSAADSRVQPARGG